ncbi:hypothetical protein E2C01_045612 [Portunus trituberculatus]|uniref:Uncharacterized protein n=1 Tax=Portunus trituberculatus TaxID=210409 RepID=A0A5B7G2J2_PORTR|nr:hypothetical protein [Portunus trituberculatus]
MSSCVDSGVGVSRTSEQGLKEARK